jgi:acetyl-CoA carboxylase biotin carboxylase subunit
MVGKLIVHGADRAAALAGAGRALAELRVAGIKTTIDFHRRLLTDDGFRSGEYDIEFLAVRESPER